MNPKVLLFSTWFLASPGGTSQLPPSLPGESHRFRCPGGSGRFGCPGDRGYMRLVKSHWWGSAGLSFRAGVLQCLQKQLGSGLEGILRNFADNTKLGRAVGFLGGREILINVKAGQSPTMWSLTRASAEFCTWLQNSCRTW